jgi:hypothetical protein
LVGWLFIENELVTSFQQQNESHNTITCNCVVNHILEFCFAVVALLEFSEELRSLELFVKLQRMESSIQLVSNTITELLRKHATELSEIPSFEFCNTPQFETDFISFLQVASCFDSHCNKTQEQSRKSLTKVESVQNSDQFYSSIKSPLLVFFQLPAEL